MQSEPPTPPLGEITSVVLSFIVAPILQLECSDCQIGLVNQSRIVLFRQDYTR